MFYILQGFYVKEIGKIYVHGFITIRANEFSISYKDALYFKTKKQAQSFIDRHSYKTKDSVFEIIKIVE